LPAMAFDRERFVTASQWEPSPCRPRINVLVRKGAPDSGCEQLLSAIEASIPIRFVQESSSALSDGRFSGVIDLLRLGETTPKPRTSEIATLAAPAASTAPASLRTERLEVRFANDSEVPFPFRGRAVTTAVSGGNCVLTLLPSERVLAAVPEGPIWAVSTERGSRHFRSALPLQEVDENGSFADVFGGDRFIENLPLLHFLHVAAPQGRWAPPPLRAAFMFDDPNLHWPSYGFIDFAETGRRAEREGYHVAFATIPLDAWFAHEPTTQVFHRYPALSLLVHGINHGKRELAVERDLRETAALLTQAVRRIELLERKTNLRVARVMVPPHGACSEQTLRALPACGFESACISSGSLKAHNPGRAWTRALGFLPTEQVAGCQVLPRWSLGGNIDNTMLVAAYLGRPMIFRGHHQDLKNGPELLDVIAARVNDLGRVRWAPLGELSRMSYQSQMVGDRCLVRSLSRHIRFAVPDSARELVVDDGGLASSEIQYEIVLNGKAFWHRAAEPLMLPEAGNRWVDIRLPALATASDAGARLPRTSASVILRRLLTESRDRMQAAAYRRLPV